MSDVTKNTRRDFLLLASAGGTGLVLSSRFASGDSAPQGHSKRKGPPKSKEEEENTEVTATEDLMREHGILRRALLVYTVIAQKLRSQAAQVPLEAVNKTTKLFRQFGEEYHERKLEEPFIFPVVKRHGGVEAQYTDILIAQHRRGQEITTYMLEATKNGPLSRNNAESLAQALESFVWMYRNHAAREDTIIFPAWKAILSKGQLSEMGEKFEEIEHQQFGQDGFEYAVRQIGDIENELGLSDLAQFTAPAPPKLQG
jgi:hemerythrin-like domain-containing protein